MAEIDEHIGVAMSGLTADARTLIDHGRVETQQHRFTYTEPMPLESVTQVLAEDSAWLSLAGCLTARLPPAGHASFRQMLLPAPHTPPTMLPPWPRLALPPAEPV